MRKESKDIENRTLSQHRLVQKEFSFFLDPAQRQEHFEDAALLLYLAFPQQVAARAMHPYHPQCALYVQHVLSLVEHAGSHGELPALKPTLEFCRILPSCAWYIHELGTYEVLERLLDKAFKIYEDFGIQEKDPMLFAKLCYQAGVMWHQLGQFEKCMARNMQCLAICQAELPADDEFIAGTSNNLGNCSESKREVENAIVWHNKCWAIWSKIDDKTHENEAHSKSNIARSLIILGQYGQATQNMNEAEVIFRNASAWFHLAQ